MEDPLALHMLDVQHEYKSVLVIYLIAIVVKPFVIRKGLPTRWIYGHYQLLRYKPRPCWRCASEVMATEPIAAAVAMTASKVRRIINAAEGCREV